MRSKVTLYLLIACFIAVDIYVFQAFKTAIVPSRPLWKYVLWGFYWAIALASWLAMYLLPLWFERATGSWKYILVTLLLGLFIGKILTLCFLLIDDLRRGGSWLYHLVQKKETAVPEAARGISRSRFLSRLGLLVGGSFLGLMIYGFSNKYNYRVHKVKLRFPNLPEAFHGLKILQLSDIHSGSFDAPEKVQKGIEKALALQPDVIFFTGDLVNSRTEEMVGYQHIFGQLSAPMGVYSILGNHDYGDYADWPSKAAKAANLQRLKDIQAAMGWKMLNNAHVTLEKDGQKIGLVGVENWSAKARFPRYGDMQKAIAGMEPVPFKILLSHDPSHWDAQVRPQYPDIDLMLSGHTHGMQFGVEIPGIKWSPIQYMYPEWAGLYRQGHQCLYVNRGFGFLGYPGRVGILPEITLIELGG